MTAAITEGDAMTDTIERAECPKCGWNTLPGADTLKHAQRSPGCPGVPVERTYVAVDALQGREAAIVADRAYEDYVEDRRTSVVEREIASMQHAFRAAIAAVTGEQP